MKLVVLAVVAVGLASVASSIWVGARVAEPTVVAHPYEQGLHYDDSRRAAEMPAKDAHGRGKALPVAAAERATDRACELSLDIAPQPVRALSELTFTVRVSRGGAPVDAAEVALALTMPGMYMGENRVALAPVGGGAFRGKGTVVRCPSGNRSWQAEVTARTRDGATVTRRFGFEAIDP